MRATTTALLALAAATSTLAFAEPPSESSTLTQIGSTNLIDLLANDISKADSENSATESHALPVAVANAEDSLLTAGEAGMITRDLGDEELEGSASGSLKVGGAANVQFIPTMSKLSAADSREDPRDLPMERRQEETEEEAPDDSQDSENNFKDDPVKAPKDEAADGAEDKESASDKENEPKDSRSGPESSPKGPLDGLKDGPQDKEGDPEDSNKSPQDGADDGPKDESKENPDVDPKKSTRDVDEEFKASGSASLKGLAALGTQSVPVAVADKQGARPFISSKRSKISARDDTQQVYGQCGGGRYSGPTECAPESKCYRRDDSYSQCLPLVQQAFGQCAGKSYFGTKDCAEGNSCKRLRADYSQCIPDGEKKMSTRDIAPEEEEEEMMTPDMDPKHTPEGEDIDPVHASMAAEMYKTTEEVSLSASAYTSSTTMRQAASYITMDTMIAIPTSETKSEMVMKTAVPTLYIAKTTTTEAMMAMPTATTHMYGGSNVTKTAGAPGSSGTGMIKPVPYEGAAAFVGLMVPGMVLGLGIALAFGMAL